MISVKSSKGYIICNVVLKSCHDRFLESLDKLDENFIKQIVVVAGIHRRCPFQ